MQTFCTFPHSRVGYYFNCRLLNACHLECLLRARHCGKSYMYIMSFTSEVKTALSPHNVYEETEVQRLCYFNSWLDTEPEAGLDAEEKTENTGRVPSLWIAAQESWSMLLRNSPAQKDTASSKRRHRGKSSLEECQEKRYHLFFTDMGGASRDEAVVTQAGGTRE